MPAPSESSVIVGVVRLAEMFGRSRKWARAKFDEWREEQEKGGPIRVWPSGRKRKLWVTTLAIVQREFAGGMRDPVILRALKQHDRDIEFLTSRLDKVLEELQHLRRQVGKRAS